MRKNGGAASFPPAASKRRCNARLVALFLSAFCSCTFGQLSVISGSGPSFPRSVDSIIFIATGHHRNHGRDSIDKSLPPAFFDTLRQNIDSVVHYVDAEKQRRMEITGCGKEPRFDNFIVFFNQKKQVMKISFSCNRFSGGMLDVKADKYPFVVTFKPAFSRSLDSLALALKAKSKRMRDTFRP